MEESKFERLQITIGLERKDSLMDIAGGGNGVHMGLIMRRISQTQLGG